MARLITICAAIGLTLASPCVASTTLVTYTGTLVGGLDGTGAYGPINGNLTGAQITILMYFDYSLGSIGPATNISLPNMSVLYGPTGTGILTSPGLGASVTIGGITRELVGNYQPASGYPIPGAHPSGYTQISEIYGVNEFIEHAFVSYACMNVSCTDRQSNTYVQANLQSFTRTDLINSFDPLAQASFDPSQFSYAGGTFRLGSPDGQTNIFDTYGEFRVTGLTISAIADSVPEPSTWLMMLLGFGALGFSLRRRRRIHVVPLQAA